MTRQQIIVGLQQSTTSQFNAYEQHAEKHTHT